MVSVLQVRPGETLVFASTCKCENFYLKRDTLSARIFLRGLTCRCEVEFHQLAMWRGIYATLVRGGDAPAG